MNMMARKLFVAGAILWFIHPLLVHADRRPLNLLMVGNYFIETHNVEEMIQTMLNENQMILQTDSIFAARFEEGGANLTHYANAPGLAKMIRERSWTWVVLQEQSETPGYCEGKPEWQGVWNASLASVLQLNSMIQMNGATTILFETWGYFDRDPYNEAFFPDYPTMQQRITHGYNIYQEQILANHPQAKVKIAPAGLAFQRIYDSIVEKGEDPHAADSLFEKLYMTLEEYAPSDGNIARKYPTLEGSYLCGCVLFQTLTGLDVRLSTFTPDGMDFQMRKLLQNIAYDTVVSFQKEGTSGEPNMSTYEYRTRAPYLPDEERGTSGGIRWILAMVVIGGSGLIYVSRMARKWQWATRPWESVFGNQDYRWNPVCHEDVNMELSDIASGSPNRTFA